MKKIRHFKLKNNGAFVARIQIEWSKTDEADRTTSGKYESSGYHDICVKAERSVDLFETNIPLGATVKLKAIVVMGKNHPAEESFIFDHKCGDTAKYEISGTTLSNKLKLK